MVLWFLSILFPFNDMCQFLLLYYMHMFVTFKIETVQNKKRSKTKQWTKQTKQTSIY